MSLFPLTVPAQSDSVARLLKRRQQDGQIGADSFDQVSGNRIPGGAVFAVLHPLLTIDSAAPASAKAGFGLAFA